MGPFNETASAVPLEICGCLVDSALAPGRSYLAIGPGGRGLVLKKLEKECLLGGLLHPSIRERLGRVRELAHSGVANLHGVGRDGADAWLMWEFVIGTRFDDWSLAPGRTDRDITAAARELVLQLDSLHMLGIIHGAVTGGNAIVEPGGAVHLTDISPLLYNDPEADIVSVFALLQHVIEARGEQHTPLGMLLADELVRQGGLRVLAARLATLISARSPEEPVAAEEGAIAAPRRRAVLAAAAAAAAGLAIAGGLWYAVQGNGVNLSLPMQQFIKR